MTIGGLTIDLVDGKPKRLRISTAAPGQRGGFGVEARLAGPADLQAVADFLSREAAAWRSGSRVTGPDPFKVLGVHPEAPWPLTVLLYKARARREHPDKGGDPKKWAEVQAAYDEIEIQHIGQSKGGETP